MRIAWEEAWLSDAGKPAFICYGPCLVAVTFGIAAALSFRTRYAVLGRFVHEEA